MSIKDDQPDRYAGEETTEGVAEAVDDLGDGEEPSLEAQWAAVDDNPRPAADLGYEGQELAFYRYKPELNAAVCCPDAESKRFAPQYIKVRREAVITDVTEWA